MKTSIRKTALPVLYLALILLGAAMPCKVMAAASMRVVVTDAAGMVMENAVVSLHSEAYRAATGKSLTVIDQVDRQFLPGVVAIQSGTAVSFPNTDDVRHHVYSFSHPNSFEIKLYHGRPAGPIRFLHEGVVVLGCNIHDGMLGYIRVVDTPLFATTGPQGKANLEGVVTGKQTLQVWHPDMGMTYHRETLRVTGLPATHFVRLDINASGPPEPPQKTVSPLQALFRD